MKLVLAALAFALTVGCGPETSVSSGPLAGGGQAPRPERPLLQVPNRGIANARPTTIDRVSFEGDRSKLRVTYWSGVEDCYGLSRVEQRWAKDSLMLTVFTGSRPLPANTACDDIALSATTIVVLEQELGNRTIVDGSTGEPARRV